MWYQMPLISALGQAKAESQVQAQSSLCLKVKSEKGQRMQLKEKALGMISVLKYMYIYFKII